MPEHVAPVGDHDVVALRLGGEEELVGQRVVLEQEAVVGGDEDVGGVGVRGLLHQVDDVAQRVLDGLEHLPLGAGLVPCGVDPVVVDVQDPVVLEQFAPLFGAQGLEVLGLDRRPTDALKDLRAGPVPLVGWPSASTVLPSGECLRVECGSSAAMPSWV